MEEKWIIICYSDKIEEFLENLNYQCLISYALCLTDDWFGCLPIKDLGLVLKVFFPNNTENLYLVLALLVSLSSTEPAVFTEAELT